MFKNFSNFSLDEIPKLLIDVPFLPIIIFFWLSDSTNIYANIFIISFDFLKEYTWTKDEKGISCL